VNQITFISCNRRTLFIEYSTSDGINRMIILFISMARHGTSRPRTKYTFRKLAVQNIITFVPLLSFNENKSLIEILPSIFPDSNPTLNYGYFTKQ
jgi:hypothetical protein